MNHHGTTSGSPAPHDAGLTVSKNTFRCTGRTRLSLLHVRESHSGRYLGGFSRCLAPTGSSLAEKFSLTSSHRSVISCILTNIGDLSSILSRNQHPKWLVKGATSVFHFRIPLPHCRRFSRLSRLAHRRQGCTATAPHSICCRRRSFLPAVPYQKSGKGYIPRNPNPPPGYSSCTLPPGSPYGKQNTPPFHRLIPHRRRKSPFFGISHIRKACNSSRIKKAIAHFRALEHFT